MNSMLSREMDSSEIGVGISIGGLCIYFKEMSQLGDILSRKEPPFCFVVVWEAENKVFEAKELVEKQYENITNRELFQFLELKDKEAMLLYLGNDYKIESGALNGEKEYVYYNQTFFGFIFSRLEVQVSPENEELLKVVLYFKELTVQETTDLHDDFTKQFGNIVDRNRSSTMMSGIRANDEHFRTNTVYYSYIWKMYDGEKIHSRRQMVLCQDLVQIKMRGSAS